MVRFPAWAAVERMLFALCLSFCATLLHAEPATVWTYKGSILALSQSGADVTITYQMLSDALKEAGAHPGDPLFRGRRTGNALSGKVYRFFGGQCQPMGFGVEGTIETSTIILRGIAPSLGLNSCNVVTTFYDNLLLTAVTTPGGSQPAIVSSAEQSAFASNVALCKTGDKRACQTVLASPLLSDEQRPAASRRGFARAERKRGVSRFSLSLRHGAGATHFAKVHRALLP